MRRRVGMLALLGAGLLVVSGCAGHEDPGRVPASASLAPKNAIGYVSIVTDEDSAQWQRADRLLGLFPEARESIVAEIERELSEDGLTWQDDVAPALGPEVVVVVTAANDVIGFTQPDDPAALDALLRASEDPAVTAEVSGWTAFAEKQADIDAYRAAMAGGSLDSVASFRSALEALPADAIALGWTDLEAVGKALAQVFGGAVESTEVGARDLAAAASAEDDGVLLSLGVRMPDGTGGTSYEPELVGHVPANAVVALSFGGTQGALDRVERTVDLEGISGALDDLFGVSLEGVLEALSGEGVLYVRGSGGQVPEVTLVLDPPDADKTWSTIEDILRNLARDSGSQIRTATEDGRTVNRLVIEELTITYTRLDGERLLVSTGADAIDAYTSGGPKLLDDDGFRRAAERVDLGERTSGFAYVDLDGLIPLVEDVAGQSQVPEEARETLQALDSLILQTSGDGDTARLEGFLRTTG